MRRTGEAHMRERCHSRAGGNPVEISRHKARMKAQGVYRLAGTSGEGSS